MRLSDKISGSLSSKYDKSILAALNEACEKKKKLKEDEDLPEVKWDKYDEYDEEEIEKINNILNNVDLEAIKHEGNKEEGYSVAVKDNNSGLVFWMDYSKSGQDIYGDWNQYIFYTNDYRDRIKQAMQTAYTDDWSFFMDVDEVGMAYLLDHGLVSDSEEGMIFESSLNEDIKDDTASAAKQIALEIQERGIMGFDEIDNMAADILGITVDKLRDEQLDTDIYISLNYEGIDNNMSTGDFYTQEYAEEHPEVLEESEKEEHIENITNNPTYLKIVNFIDNIIYSEEDKDRKQICAQLKKDMNIFGNLEESEKKEDLKEETLNETDATPEFLEDLKNLINNYMRVSEIAQITLDNMEGEEYAVIVFESGGVKRINITANSNLAVARAILFELA